MLKEGRLQPWEMDKTNPSVLAKEDELYLLDDKNPIRKFTENGAEKSLTALDLAMNGIKARKPESFAEKIKTDSTGKPIEDMEIAIVGEHFDRYSEQFSKVGTSKDNLVAAFKFERQKDKDLTAEVFFVVEGLLEGPRRLLGVVLPHSLGHEMDDALDSNDARSRPTWAGIGPTPVGRFNAVDNQGPRPNDRWRTRS